MPLLILLLLLLQPLSVGLCRGKISKVLESVDLRPLERTDADLERTAGLSGVESVRTTWGSGDAGRELGVEQPERLPCLSLRWRSWWLEVKLQLFNEEATELQLEDELVVLLLQLV